MGRWRLKLDLTSVIVLIAVGVLLPVLLSTAAGITALFVVDSPGGIITGVMVICFTVAAGGSALVAVVLTARKARLARLQADFIANITHELRTPLSSIRLHTQTLQSGLLVDDPESAKECLSSIARETEWLDVMMDKVLTWRAAAGDMLPLEWVEQPVEPAVSAALERFRSMVPPDGMDLAFENASRQSVRHDPGALNAVILNLLTNAYNNMGEVKIIRVAIRDEGHEVVITVRDNGVGILPADAERIFQPFYRVKLLGGGDSGGVGLGLAVVRYVINRHGGVIRASSAEPEGSVFTIRLPAVREK